MTFSHGEKSEKAERVTLATKVGLISLRIFPIIPLRINEAKPVERTN